MFTDKKILFLSPHPDDIEFCCGGTLAKLKEQGCDIMVCAFSDCAESVPKELPDYALVDEWNNAMDLAGITQRKMHDYPVRNFAEYRQDILETLVDIESAFNPDIVFFPSANDNHQDHIVIHNETLRAFKNAKLISYEIPLNSFEYSFNLIVELEQRHIYSKQEAIACYESQKFRHYSDPEYVLNLAKVAGVLIKKSFAEVFKIIRWTA